MYEKTRLKCRDTKTTVSLPIRLYERNTSEKTELDFISHQREKVLKRHCLLYPVIKSQPTDRVRKEDKSLGLMERDGTGWGKIYMKYTRNRSSLV